MPRTSKLTPLLEFLDPELSNAENAEKLFSIATGIGVKTSLESVRRFIEGHKRKERALKAPAPKSVEPVKPKPSPKPKVVKEPEQDLALETFDSIVESLYALRKYVAETIEENSRMRERLRRIKEQIE